MQTFCITACKYYSFLLMCITRATSFDSSLAHFGDNCFKKKTPTTCFYLISIKKHHLHSSLSGGRLRVFLAADVLQPLIRATTCYLSQRAIPWDNFSF